MLKITDKNGREWKFEESEAVYRKSVYGCAIYNNQVLLVLDPRTDEWEIPGGGVEPGETDSQALIREVKEETGLDADISEVKLIEKVVGYYKGIDRDHVLKTDRNYFRINIKNPDGPILEKGNRDDTIECKWVNLNDINMLNMAKIDQGIVRKVISK